MCGQCCRMIHFPQGVHETIQNSNFKPDSGSDMEFIRENMEYLGNAEEVEGSIKSGFPEWPRNKIHIYKCKLITDDNKCSIHENKPRICSGYPYYEDGKTVMGGPWPYKGCAYERDYYELRMIRVLKNYLIKIEPEIKEVMIKERSK